MKLSVIMPVYNEATTVLEGIERVLALSLPLELIAVNDGSTDASAAIMAGVRDPRFKMLSEPKNRGKGWAIRRAIEVARGDVVIIQDADLEYDPSDYEQLLTPIKEGRALVVYGNRLHSGNTRFSYLRYLLGGMLLTFVTNLLYGCSLHDEPTCYKLMDARILKALRLQCVGFEFCPEVTAKVCRLGYRIVEMPISYTPRNYEEGKKIHFMDGLKALWVLFRTRFQRASSFVEPGAALPRLQGDTSMSPQGD